MDNYKLYANLIRKPDSSDFNARPCVVEKWIPLSHWSFEQIKQDPLHDLEAVKAYRDIMFCDNEANHCIISVTERCSARSIPSFRPLKGRAMILSECSLVSYMTILTAMSLKHCARSYPDKHLTGGAKALSSVRSRPMTAENCMSASTERRTGR